jgi:hypothetical protein
MPPRKLTKRRGLWFEFTARVEYVKLDFDAWSVFPLQMNLQLQLCDICRGISQGYRHQLNCSAIVRMP